MNKIIRYSTIGVFIFIVFGYSVYQSRNIVKGPSIIITEPENGTSFNHSPITIKGQAFNNTEISIDNRLIFIDEKGIFKEKYLLSPGYNIITIVAKDKFGKTVKKILELVYQ